MSPVTWIVLGFVTLITVLAVAATVALVAQHVRRLVTNLRSLQDEVAPELERLRTTAEVTRTELERVQDGREELRASRDG